MTGHNSIKMTDLALLYKDLGFSNAETYIQSGNVIFSYVGEGSPSDISQIIERAILEKFNYTVPVMVRSVKEIKELLSCNPFINEEKFDPSKMAVIFLNEEASDIQIQKVINVDYPPDRFEIIGKEIFIFCPNGFARTKLYTNFFEKKMGVKGTARNWKTITTIMRIGKKKEKQNI